jgi:hypothetical protein
MTWSSIVVGRPASTAAVLGLAALLASLPSAAQVTTGLEEVLIQVVHPQMRVELRFVPGALRLIAREITAEVPRSFEDLLRSENIVPDGEGHLALYRLNPELRVPAVPAGRRVRVPSLTGPDSLRRAFEDGYKAYLTFDLALKQQIRSHGVDLVQALARVRDLPADRLGGEQAKRDLVVQLDSIRLYSAVVTAAIENRTRPIDTPLLRTIQLELDEAFSVARLIDTVALLPEEDRDVVKALASQAEVRLATRYWEETLGAGGRGGGGGRGGDTTSRMTLYPKVPVTVRVLAAGSPNADVPGYIVYYMAEGFYRRWLKEPGNTRLRSQLQSFGRTESPMTEELLVVDYMFWAAKVPETPITQVRRIQVRAQGRGVAQPIDLPIIP